MKRIALLLGAALLFCLPACGETSVAEMETPGKAEADQCEPTAGSETARIPEETPAPSHDHRRNGGNRGRNGGPGGGMMGGTSTDPEIQAVLNGNAGKFEQFTFEDPDTGLSLEYSLYSPEGYDGTQKYPLLMFIPDSTGAGKTAKQIVEQYYGATVWVTEEDQAKHPSFVLVPAFTETVVDDNWNTSEQIEAAVRLLTALQTEYSIDADRLYGTGQSMGCMTSLYLNSKYPDLFAASLFVSGQWDIFVLEPLKEQTFFYITAGGDAKASGG